MKSISMFTTLFLGCISLVIVITISMTEPDEEQPEVLSTAVEQIREKGYNVYKFDRGYCADRVVRDRLNYIATYCNGEHGKVTVNIPHTSTVNWDEVYSKMMKEVDSLAARYITDYLWTQ